MTTEIESAPKFDVNTYISEQVVMAMFRKKLKHGVVAARAGLTAAQFSKSVNGQRRWQAEDVYSVAAALGVEPGVLLPHLDSNQEPSD